MHLLSIAVIFLSQWGFLHPTSLTIILSPFLLQCYIIAHCCMYTYFTCFTLLFPLSLSLILTFSPSFFSLSPSIFTLSVLQFSVLVYLNRPIDFLLYIFVFCTILCDFVFCIKLFCNYCNLFLSQGPIGIQLTLNGLPW